MGQLKPKSQQVEQIEGAGEGLAGGGELVTQRADTDAGGACFSKDQNPTPD